MSKYVPIEMVKSYSGKICMHSKTYFAKRGNTLYTGTICNPSTKDPTEGMLAQRTKFKNAVTSAKAVLADAEQRAALELQFAAQKKYSTLLGYAVHIEYDKL